MKLIPVDQIPKMNGYHKLQDLIEEFVNGDAKVVRVAIQNFLKKPVISTVLGFRTTSFLA